MFLLNEFAFLFLHRLADLVWNIFTLLRDNIFTFLRIVDFCTDFLRNLSAALDDLS